MDIDYSLYLVTGRELLPPGKNYLESLEESLKGGVTVVQVREKTADSGEFYSIALETKALCRKYNVPLIINDRVDIALAVQADGVHLGTDDLPISVARTLLPVSTIIGVSVNSPEEARKAVEDGADYVGVSAVWETKSKNLTKPVIGVRGVGPILDALGGAKIKAVAIGGIKAINALHLLHGSVSPINSRRLDGIAVISDIVASTNPQEATKTLRTLITAFQSRSPATFSTLSPTPTAEAVRNSAAALISTLHMSTPLIHHITNQVVMTQSANTTLALHASPLVSSNPLEMDDLAKISGALLVNYGTLGELEGMLLAGKRYNQNRKPIVFDPVGVGATQLRRDAAHQLLNTWQATVIKGNAGEIGALAGSAEACVVRTRGVDSIGNGFSKPETIVLELAKRERCIIVMTGEKDYLSDGRIVVRLSNGHPILAQITGSGCIVGTAVATFCAAARLAASQPDQQEKVDDALLTRGDMMVGAVAGVLAITIASEIAANRDDVRGSGTFLPALIDELGKLTRETIISKANIEIL